MHTPLHELFLAKVVKEIETRLEIFGDDEGVEDRPRAFAMKIRHQRSSDLIRNDDKGKPILRNSPDASFQHTNARWPGVVLKVSYS